MIEFKAAWLALKAFLVSAKWFIICFVVLFIFVSLSQCRSKPPEVHVNTPPPISGEQVKKAVNNLDTNIAQNQTDEKKTNDNVKDTTVKFNNVVTKVKKDTVKTDVEKEKAVANATIDALDAIYYSYYSHSTSEAIPAT